MELNYLIDTNVVIDFFKGKLPPNAMSFLSELVNSKVNISVISKIELLGFPNSSKNELTLLTEFCDEAKIFSLDDSVIKETIRLRQKHKIRLPDSIIAATALTHEFSLITHNINDFKNIPNLTVLDSHKL